MSALSVCFPSGQASSLSGAAAIFHSLPCLPCWGFSSSPGLPGSLQLPLPPNPFSTPLELSPFAQDRIPSFPTHWLPGIPGYKPVPTAQCSALPFHLDLHRLFACCSLQFSLNLFFIHFPSSLIFTLLLRSCLVPVGAQVPAGLGGAAPTGSTPAQGLPCLQGRKGPKGKCEERPCETRAEKTGYISPDFFKVLVKKPSWTPWQLVRYAASAKLQVKSTYVHKFMSSQGV